MKGQLFILEGPDGAGKSTTANALADSLRAGGAAVRLFAFPGNELGTLGKLVHHLHHRPEDYGIGAIHPTSIQILHAAAHVDAIYTKIRPAYEQGETIIMDRFWWSTMVYGRLANVGERTLELLEQLARHHWEFADPTAAFVLLGPKEQSGHDETMLRGAYSDFVGSLNANFPIYTLEREESVSYSTYILDKIGKFRRSVFP